LTIDIGPCRNFQDMEGFAVGKRHLLHLQHALVGNCRELAGAEEEEALDLLRSSPGVSPAPPYFSSSRVTGRRQPLQRAEVFASAIVAAMPWTTIIMLRERARLGEAGFPAPRTTEKLRSACSESVLLLAQVTAITGCWFARGNTQGFDGFRVVSPERETVISSGLLFGSRTIRASARFRGRVGAGSMPTSCWTSAAGQRYVVCRAAAREKARGRIRPPSRSAFSAPTCRSKRLRRLVPDLRLAGDFAKRVNAGGGVKMRLSKEDR